MPANDTPPLDATARAALRAKAEAALDAIQAWENGPANGFGAIDRLNDMEDARGKFEQAATPDVILALLAAVERGEAETALLRDLLKYVDDDAHSAALHGETDEIPCAFGDRIRATLAARAHPPIQETDNGESR